MARAVDDLVNVFEGAALGQVDLFHDDLASNMQHRMRLGIADLQHDELGPNLEEHLKLGSVQLCDNNTNVNDILGPNLGLHLSLDSPWQPPIASNPIGMMDLDDL